MLTQVSNCSAMALHDSTTSLHTANFDASILDRKTLKRSLKCLQYFITPDNDGGGSVITALFIFLLV